MSSLESTLPATAGNAPRRPPAGVRILFSLLARLARGSLTVTLPDGSCRRFEGAERRGLHADLSIAEWSVCGDLLAGGDLAFAEAYMAGRCNTSDLTALLTVAAQNATALEPAFYARGWPKLLSGLRHLLRANTRAQARRNIHAHYDLGNAFYALWLDPTMTYSAAWFDGDLSCPLARAQEAKYERILRALDPRPGAHLLEIGCGWGGFAEYAARTRDVRVTGISLSAAQTEHARRRVADAGLADRVRVELRDYRDLTGRFDGIASIEMFEAVGERWWTSYFATLRRSLAPGARACIQTITIADARFARYRGSSDFIQQYIFPGGMLASPSRFAAHASRAGLAVRDRHAFGPDYAETLRRWLAAFDAHEREVRALGFDSRFLRCWRFYLAYCIAGFESGSTDVHHFTLQAC